MAISPRHGPRSTAANVAPKISLGYQFNDDVLLYALAVVLRVGDFGR